MLEFTRTPSENIVYVPTEKILMNFTTSHLAIAASLVSGLAFFGQMANTPFARSPSLRPTTERQWPVVEGTVMLPNFKFGDGNSLPALRLHYLTLGKPHRNAAGHTDNVVLLLHGTGGDSHSLLSPAFSGVLFGRGALLDINKYFLIFPDDIGHGQSSKPSDGLRARFPAYDYDDMVRSQRMMLDTLKIDHLRLILGTSMGCMQAFVWGETYPGFADALAPFACLPAPIAGRNRMMRYMAIQAIKQDPAWLGGEYKTEPLQSLRTVEGILLVMTSSPLQMQKQAATRELAESYVDRYLARASSMDANDAIFYLNASRNYNPSPHLEKIIVPVLWINSADDYVNPPELHIAETIVKRMPKARFVLIPISDATRGHGTHTQAAVWQNYLADLLKISAPES
jgi:homoserine O-acetyltransferase/O-succinyltransferase